MVKKRISFDIDIPGGGRKKAHRIHARKKARKMFTGGGIYADVYTGYKKRMLDLVADFLNREFGVIVDWMKDFLSLKRKLKALALSFALLVAGLIIILMGVAEFLDCRCTSLPCGANYVLVGLVVLVIALVYKKIFV